MPLYTTQLQHRLLALALTMVCGHSIAAPRGVCPKMEWPREALLYELEGATTMRYTVNEDGKAATISVQRGAGWKMLDDAAVRILRGCTFDDSERDGKARAVQYVWTLDGEPTVHPTVVAGSCMPSPAFTGFSDLDKSASNEEGVLLRMMINKDGTPLGIKAEAPNLPGATVRAAIAYAQSCKFAIPLRLAAPLTLFHNTYGRVTIRRP